MIPCVDTEMIFQWLRFFCRGAINRAPTKKPQPNKKPATRNPELYQTVHIIQNSSKIVIQSTICAV